MIKLYILSIIFCSGCLYLATQHASSLIDKLDIEIEVDTKKDRLKGFKSLIVASVIPVLNIIIGLSCILILTGKYDDMIIKKINEKISC